ncbi:MAG: hypothetical protein ABFD77_02170 [Thermotogota bacterium]
MNWELVALLLYVLVGVACVLIGEIGSRKWPEDGPGPLHELTLLGFFLITVLWPVFLVGVSLEVVRDRRKR